MRVIIDFDRWNSTGLCTAIAPEVFELDEREELQVDAESARLADGEQLEEAAHACPRQAITLQDGA